MRLGFKTLVLVLCLALLPPASAWCCCRHDQAASTAIEACCGAPAQQQGSGQPTHDEGSCSCPAMRAKLFVETPQIAAPSSWDFSLPWAVESGLNSQIDLAPAYSGTGPPGSSVRPLFPLSPRFIVHRALLQ